MYNGLIQICVCPFYRTLSSWTLLIGNDAVSGVLVTIFSECIAPGKKRCAMKGTDEAAVTVQTVEAVLPLRASFTNNARPAGEESLY